MREFLIKKRDLLKAAALCEEVGVDTVKIIMDDKAPRITGMIAYDINAGPITKKGKS